MRFFTDAAQSSGYKMVFGKHWAYGTWPDAWKAHNICFLEFFLIFAPLSTCFNELRSDRVLFFTDNDSVVHVINNQTTKDTKMLRLLRRMVLICLRNNIFFRTRHIPEGRG